MADRRGPRLAVLDDGLFVRTQAGEVRPLSATFNRFVEAVARTGAFSRVRYLVPVRDLHAWEVEPPLDPVDETCVEVVPTTWFSGIADYLVRAGYVAARNWVSIDRAVADSDLLWLRLPASNALLGLAAARHHGVAHFGWVAGSVAAVAASGQRLAPMGVLARAAGEAYDAVTRLAGSTGPLIELDAEIFASVFTDDDVAASRAELVRSELARAQLSGADGPAGGSRAGSPRRIVWAGRMAAEKGLVDLIDVVGAVSDGGRDVTLVLIGDGPARPAVERALADSRLPAERVEDYGYVGDRSAYMALLRGGDLFVHTSRTEGVPKALTEAMACGLPIVATDAGNSSDLLGHGERGRVVPAGDADAMVKAIQELLDDDAERAALRRKALDWAQHHTAESQARRLVDRLAREFPGLDWPA